MRTWRVLLGSMLVWTVHFFGAYIIASIFPERIIAARVLVAVLTLACLTALFWLTRRSLAQISQGDDELSGWVARLGAALGAIAFVALLWQAFPILFLKA